MGELFSFTLFLAFLVGPIVQMANIGTQMTEAFAGLDRTGRAALAAGRGRRPAARTVDDADGRGARLRFDGVSFAYEEDKPVLQ